MTRTTLRNGQPTPLEPGAVASATEPYEKLCRRARALGHDASFLALLRRPGLGLSDAVRLALDAVPALELLPLPVLAEEFGAVLSRAQTPGRSPARRVGLA